jgi:hypothetical protein
VVERSEWRLDTVFSACFTAGKFRLDRRIGPSKLGISEPPQYSSPIARAIQIARSIPPGRAAKLRPLTIKDKAMRHILLIVMMLISAAASAETIRIPWNGDYPHNSSKHWSKDNPYDSGFSKNFLNGAPEEGGKILKDGELDAEILLPENTTGPIPFALVLHGGFGLDRLTADWAHRMAKVLNDEGVGALILDS